MIRPVIRPVIRPGRPEDAERLAAICAAAFAPVHEGFAAALGPELFALGYPDWRGGYRRDLAAMLAGGAEVFVAEEGGAALGFVAAKLGPGEAVGEIALMAVDPAHQRRGIGAALLGVALERLKARGARAATVGTGGDAAHAPARALYRAGGFDRTIPSLHAYRLL